MISKEFRNKGRFLQIFIITLLCEVFLWWICPVSLISGIVVITITIYFYIDKKFEEKYPNISYLYLGIIVSLIWALIYGALEFYVFQNPTHPLYLFQWFSTASRIGYIAYWSFLILSNFFIVYFITRNLTLSIILTLFYCVNEDFSYWIFYGIANNSSIMPPPMNWFEAFDKIFPQWFIVLGTHIDIWPYVPIIYILVWSFTVPSIILMLILVKKYKKR